MTRLHSIRLFALPLLAVLFSTYSVPAIAYEPPAVQTQGDISYITGGIGERETKDLRSQRGKYGLRIVNAGAKGGFTGSTHITIKDRKGHEMLDTDGGPLFYANLPAGKYTVIATTEEHKQTKKIIIARHKPTNLRFVW